MNDGCGPNISESFAIYDPDTSLWRMSQGSLLSEWETFSGTWPRSGMTRSGRAYLRPLLALPISDGGSSLWPTPTANESGRNRSASPGAQIRPSLGMMAAKDMWPMPGTRDRSRDAPNRKGPSLGVAVRGRSTTTGQLNPTWVEWLMGFPPGWTDLEDSETLSSHKSPNG